MEYKIIDLVFPILVHFLALQLTGILGIGDAAFQTMLAAVITMPLFFWFYRKDQNLWRKEKRGHIRISLLRFATGYVLAAVSAILLGLILGSLPKVFQFINPILQIIRPIAPVAFLPFIVFWFGIGDVPAIVIIFIAGFFPILLSVVAAVQHVDGIYYKIANSFGVGKVKTLFGIVFPAIFTQIANALRLALGTSWIFLVSGEMVGAQSGLGFLIMDSKNCMRFDALLATMITIGVIGFILDGLLRFAEKAISTKIGFGV